MAIRYIINGKFLGEVPRISRVNSEFFICPICGEHWASILVDGGEYYPNRRPCRQHEWAGMIPGSILGYIEDPRWQRPNCWHVSLERVPDEVLAYELEVHINALEKGITVYG